MNPRHVEILTLNRELVGLTRAGIPLPTGLKELATGGRGDRLEVLARQIAEHLERGLTLSAALEATRGYPPFYATLVRVGEASGNLLNGLEAAVRQGADRERLERQITAAAIYPASLFCLGLLLVALLMTSVVKPLGRSFSFRDFVAIEGIPLYTASNELSHTAIWSLAFTVMAGILTLFFTQRGRRWLHWYVGAFPGIRQVHEEYRRARVTRLLGTLLGAGIPASEAVALSNDFLDEGIRGKELGWVRRELERGRGLGETLQRLRLLPRHHRPLLPRAEARGQLGVLLMELSVEYEDRYERSRGVMIAMLEPFLLLMSGIFCGYLLVTVYLPFFRLPKQIAD